MSYSALILKDSPQAIWALEETSGLVVKADAFAGSEYNGQYYKDESNVDKFIRTGVPITFGGKVCISNNQLANFTTDRRIFSIPSFKNLSISKKYKTFSLEFWMNLDNNEVQNINSPINKIGESKIVGWSGSSNSGIYIRDMDYLVFRVGDVGYRAFESAVHVPSFNTPLHIVVAYEPTSIQIIVNGVEGNKQQITENIFGQLENRNIEFCLPEAINENIGTISFGQISFDTIAIYPYFMSSSIAKRHYVYGLGYSVPKNRIKALAGVHYGTDMQKTSPLKQLNYISSGTWRNSVNFNNLIVTQNNISTVKYSNQEFYISSPNSDSNYSAMVSDSGDHFIFPSDSYSYIEINNYESITNGSTKKIDAQFEITPSHSTSELQQLMYIGSKINSEKYLSFMITDKTVSAYYKKPGIDESLVGTFTLASSTKFYISITVDNYSGNYAKIRIGASGPETTMSVEVSATSLFPLEDSYIRFGTKPIFFGNSVPSNISISDTRRFDGYLNQVDIYDSNITTDTFSQLPVKKISDLYQLYPNSMTKKYCVATSGTLEFTLSLLDLCGLDKIGKDSGTLNLALRTEVGSALSDIKYTLNKITGTATSPVSNPISGYENLNVRELHLPKLNPDVKAEALQYKIIGTVRSTDSITTPGILEYFRIYTYNTQIDETRSYIEITEDNPSNNMRYYSGDNGIYNYPFKTLPDLDRTTDIYRSYHTGIKVGDYLGSKPYLMIPFNTRTITSNENPKVYTIMFSGVLNAGSKNNMSLFKYNDSTPITWLNIQPLGVTTYINGLPYSGNQNDYDPYSWNHYTFVINSGIDHITSTANLYFGYPQENGAEWNIDNVNVFVSLLDAENVLNIYNSYFGVQGNRYGDGSPTMLNVYMDDRELSDGESTYQIILGQSEFVPSTARPRLVSVSPMTLSQLSPPVSGQFKMFYDSLTRDKVKVDNVEVNLNDIILLKDQAVPSQNGFYKVIDKTSTFLHLQKQTNSYYVNNNSVCKPIEGLVNKNWYFKKVNDTFNRTVVQKKVKAYTINSPIIQFVDI